MLTCKDVATRASDLIDGDLSTWQILRMRLHLAMCNGCERFIGQMRTIRDLTNSRPATGPYDEAGDDRINKVLSQLHDGKQQGG